MDLPSPEGSCGGCIWVEPTPGRGSTGSGYAVLEAADGEAGVASAKSEHPERLPGASRPIPP